MIRLGAHGVTCQTCLAAAGSYCVTADGKPRRGYCRTRHVAAGTFFVRRRRRP